MPGILLCFLLFGGRIALGQWSLAVDLFAERDWVACHRECVRLLTENPEWVPARALAAVARLHWQQNEEALQKAEKLAFSLTDPDLRASVFYELGRFCWSQGEITNAARFLEKAFVAASEPALNAQAGCSLYQLLRQTRSELGVQAATRLQLETMAETWDRSLWRATALTKAESGPMAKPADVIVAFYRRQIAPAIGARCSLSPSCSEYFKQAGHHHGLMAFPIMADRFVREPSVVQAQEHPVIVGDQQRFRDEVEWHTYWWAKEGQAP